MGYLRNQLATVVVSAFAAFLTAMYFVMPAALNQLLIVGTIVTWFLAFICWISQKSADYAHKYSHSEKKSSITLEHSTSVLAVSEISKFKESFAAELDELKKEVKLKDDEINRLRQQVNNLETLVQIEALKAELANLKALAAKEDSVKRK
jgi:ribosomal protein L25 (general stress protein Ctc)